MDKGNWVITEVGFSQEATSPRRLALMERYLRLLIFVPIAHMVKVLATVGRSLHPGNLGQRAKKRLRSRAIAIDDLVVVVGGDLTKLISIPLTYLVNGLAFVGFSIWLVFSFPFIKAFALLKYMIRALASPVTTAKELTRELNEGITMAITSPLAFLAKGLALIVLPLWLAVSLSASYLVKGLVAVGRILDPANLHRRIVRLLVHPVASATGMAGELNEGVTMAMTGPVSLLLKGLALIVLPLWLAVSLTASYPVKGLVAVGRILHPANLHRRIVRPLVHPVASATGMAGELNEGVTMAMTGPVALLLKGLALIVLPLWLAVSLTASYLVKALVAVGRILHPANLYRRIVRPLVHPVTTATGMAGELNEGVTMAMTGPVSFLLKGLALIALPFWLVISLPSVYLAKKLTLVGRFLGPASLHRHVARPVASSASAVKTATVRSGRCAVRAVFTAFASMAKGLVLVGWLLWQAISFPFGYLAKWMAIVGHSVWRGVAIPSAYLAKAVASVGHILWRGVSIPSVYLAKAVASVGHVLWESVSLPLGYLAKWMAIVGHSVWRGASIPSAYLAKAVAPVGHVLWQTIAIPSAYLAKAVASVGHVLWQTVAIPSAYLAKALSLAASPIRTAVSTPFNRLKDGKAGVSLEDLTETLVASFKAKVPELVKAGRLSEEDAAKLSQELQEQLSLLVAAYPEPTSDTNNGTSKSSTVPAPVADRGTPYMPSYGASGPGPPVEDLWKAGQG